jgi:hypothetical protein
MEDQQPSPQQQSGTPGRTDVAGTTHPVDVPTERRPATRRKPDLVPILTLGGLMLIVLAGWLLFPKVAAYMRVQECLASFRTPSVCR